MNINQLRNNRKNDFSQITAELEKTNSDAASYSDDRLWKPERDKAGNATATIRFLPRTIKIVDGKEIQDDLPWAKVFSHAFQGPSGKWLIENCNTSIGDECPVN